MNLMVNPTITGFRQEVDGTIKELKLGEAKEDAYANIIEQGSADLENNKAATINVLTYTQPVEVTPSSGKDGMKKATITLTNIPSGSNNYTFYAWKAEGGSPHYTTTENPEVGDKLYGGDESDTGVVSTSSTITAIGEGTVTAGEDTFPRYQSGDLTFTKE